MRINSNDLRHRIEKGNIENIYLFGGPEVGEKNEVIQLIESKLFPDEEATKFTFYCGEDFDLVEFINTLETGLLFSTKKIVYLKNVENIKKEAIKIIEDYIIPRKIEAGRFESEILKKISNPQTGKKLLTFFSKKDDFYLLSSSVKSKDKKNIIEIFHSAGFTAYNPDNYLVMLNETNDKIPQSLQDLLLPEQNIIFWEMFENQKITWIREEFRKKSLFIDEEAILFILDMIENNKAKLTEEIKKISDLYNASGKKDKKGIDLVFIEEYLFHSKTETPFSLFGAILNKNLSKAMDILETLFLTDEFGLLNGFIWSHRRFLKAIDLFENQNMSTGEIFGSLYIITKKDKDDFEAGFKNYKFSHIAAMFYDLSELDYYLKVLPNNMKLVKLQEFIINFVNGDYQKSFLQGPLQFLQY